jgi:hypothetical protein
MVLNIDFAACEPLSHRRAEISQLTASQKDPQARRANPEE